MGHYDSSYEHTQEMRDKERKKAYVEAQRQVDKAFVLLEEARDAMKYYCGPKDLLENETLKLEALYSFVFEHKL